MRYERARMGGASTTCHSLCTHLSLTMYLPVTHYYVSTCHSLCIRLSLTMYSHLLSGTSSLSNLFERFSAVDDSELFAELEGED